MSLSARHRESMDLLAVLSIALVFFGLAGPAAAQGSKDVKLGLLPIDSSIQAFVAKDKGFFREEGLTVTIAFMAGGAVIAPAVEGGELQIGFSNAVSIILAHMKGFDFQFLAEAGIHLAEAPTLKLLVRKDSDINAPKDLEGKVVGTNTLGGIDEVSLRAWAKQNQVDLKKVQVVEIPFPQMVAALSSKRVHGVMIGEPFMTLAEAQVGTRTLGVPWSAISRRLMISGYFAKKSWAEANKETVEAFVRAIQKATQFVNGHPGELGAILANNTRISKEVADKIVRQAYSERFRRADLQVWIDPLQEMGFIDKKIDVAPLISKFAHVEQ